MPTLNADKKATLLRHAEEVADALAAEFGRARIGGWMYSAADISRGAWSCRVTATAPAPPWQVRRTVRVFLNGTHEIVYSDADPGL